MQPDFSIPSHPEFRIAEDLCNYSHTSDGQPLPGMAAPAKQTGQFIGRDIAAIVANRPRPASAKSISAAWRSSTGPVQWPIKNAFNSPAGEAVCCGRSFILC